MPRLAALFFTVHIAAFAQTTVPFVGCPSVGQVESNKAPKGKPKRVSLSPQIASQLAHYSGGGHDVLAPRGWHCLAAVGSGGEVLLVAPTADVIQSFEANNGRILGPAILAARHFSETSGRYAAAEVAARVFPSQRKLAVETLQDIDRPVPEGAFPTDQLTYRSNDIVEFTTPANTDGLGTLFRLGKDDTPIRGLEILLHPEPNIIDLSVRLSSTQSHLTDAIIHQFELDAEHFSR